MNYPIVKIVLIGNARSGKSQAIAELQGNIEHNHVYRATRGVNVKNVERNNIYYTIWESCGNSTRHVNVMTFQGHYRDTNMVVCFPGGENYRTPAQWAATVPEEIGPIPFVIYKGDLGAILDSIGP